MSHNNFEKAVDRVQTLELRTTTNFASQSCPPRSCPPLDAPAQLPSRASSVSSFSATGIYCSARPLPPEPTRVDFDVLMPHAARGAACVPASRQQRLAQSVQRRLAFAKLGLQRACARQLPRTVIKPTLRHLDQQPAVRLHQGSAPGQGGALGAAEEPSTAGGAVLGAPGQVLRARCADATACRAHAHVQHAHAHAHAHAHVHRVGRAAAG